MPDRSKNILFFGNDLKLVSNLQVILEKSLPGSNLVTANSLEDFNQKLSRQAFQVCLLDSSLLKNSDTSILSEVYKLTPDLPFIFLLDEEKRTLGKEVLNHGAFDYLVKVDGALSALPFTIDQVLEKRPTSFRKAKEAENRGESIPQTGFFEINESSRLITFDEGLIRLVGLEEKELFKTYLTDLLPENDRDKFYAWRASVWDKSEGFHLNTQIVNPEKGVVPVELHLFPYELEKHFSGFRGYLKVSPEHPAAEEETEEKAHEKPDFYYEIHNLNAYLSKGLHQLFLMKVAEIPMKYFKFQHVYLFLWDEINHRFQKEICLQNENSSIKEELRSQYFSPNEVRFLNESPAFAHFVHQSLLSAESREKVYGANGEGLFQKSEWKPGNPWKKGDRLFLSIRDSRSNLLGFLILESPEKRIPPQWVFQQLEVFSIFISTLFEGDARFQHVNNQHKRLKQLFTILGAFHLETSLSDLLREVAWSVKFAMGYNLVMLAVLSRTTHRLELKAVAVDNRQKGRILSRLRFTPDKISHFLINRFKISQSFFITQKDNPFYLIKRIYGLPLSAYTEPDIWYYPDVLLVPLRSKNGKIMGMFILDDPENHKKPDIETIQIIEKIAKTVAVTIENKMQYTQLLKEIKRLKLEFEAQMQSNGNSAKIRSFFKRISL